MKPHNQELGDGYSIRMGKRVPEDAANLAYIGHTTDNVPNAIVNVTDNVPHTETNPYIEIMYPDESYKLISAYQSGLVHSQNILVTNIFTLDTDRVPLYYQHTLSGVIARTSTEPTIYTGSDISVRKLNMEMSDERYMVMLTPTGTPGTSNVTIYTNFRGDRFNVYQAVYPKYDVEENEELTGSTELMNLIPIFTKVEKVTPWPGAYDGELVYAIEAQDGGGYRIYVTTSGTGEPEETREPEYFEYEIEAEYDVNCSHGAPGTLKVGLIPIEQFPGPSIRDFLRILHNRRPSYLTLMNPHPYLMRLSERSDPSWIQTSFEHDRDIQQYWLADINMPLHHMYDYDMLIIAGYGTHALTADQQSNLDKYLARGGSIWIDNNGMVEGAQLSLTDFPIDISFNYEDLTGGALEWVDFMQLLTRYNVIAPGQMTEFADTKIHIDCNHDDLEVMVLRHFDDVTPVTQNKLIFCTYQNRGKVLLSATALVDGVIRNRPHTIKMAVNILLRLFEHGWCTSGRRNSAVLEKASMMHADYKSNTLTLPYHNGYSNDPSPKIVALRQLMRHPFRRTMQNSLPPMQRHDIARFQIRNYSDNVHISPVRTFYNPGDLVYAYTDRDTNPWVPTETSVININYPTVNLYYTIEAFVYNRESDTAVYQPYLAVEDIGYRTHELNLSAYDGLCDGGPDQTLMPLPVAAPGLRSGTAWVDKSKVYFRIRLGRYINNIWNPGKRNANIYLYDIVNERYRADRNGEIIISATDVTDNMLIKVDTHEYEAVLTNDYAVKTLPSIIQLEQPVEPYEASPWYLRVRNGNFTITANITKDQYGNTVPGISNTYRYQLPEFQHQAFDPPDQESTMRRNLEVAQFVDNDLIRVSRTPMVIDEDHEISVIKREHDLVTVRSEELSTTDSLTFYAQNDNWMMQPSPIIQPPDFSSINYEAGSVTFGTAKTSVTADYTYAKDTTLDVVAYDENSGTIHIAQDIDHVDNILASYYYQQKYYTYHGYMDGATFWHLDLNPAPGHYITYYGETGPTDVETHKLLGEMVYIYILPYTDGSTFNEQTVRHTFGEQNWQTIRSAYPRAILLGKVQVREASSPDDLVIFDTRSRGGGLKQRVKADQMNAVASKHDQPSAADHYWDVGAWDGDAYQTQGVSVFTLPKKLKVDYGGQFTEDDVIEIVRKQLSLGIIPVIDYAESDEAALNATAKVRARSTVNLASMVYVIDSKRSEQLTLILDETAEVDRPYNLLEVTDDLTINTSEYGYPEEVE